MKTPTNGRATKPNSGTNNYREAAPLRGFNDAPTTLARGKHSDADTCAPRRPRVADVAGGSPLRSDPVLDEL